MNANNLQQTVRDAIALMRTGDLNAATQSIQRGLQRAPSLHRDAADAPPGKSSCIDGQSVVVSDAAGPADPDSVQISTTAPYAQSEQTGGFAHAEGAREYLVYAPTHRGVQPAPLILMLHGCTQDAADFARGTRVHQRAAAEGYVVVYPTQTRSHNSGGCWNWFRPGDQQRGKGEPALLAGLVLEMLERFDCDPSRVYVAGLSAGAAMAVTLGRLYPDIFRAVGAHSGLAYGAAHDVPSALSAMRSGAPRKPLEGAPSCEFVPTIAFHGDRDQTVAVANARLIMEDATAAWAGARAPETQGRLEFSTTEGVASGRGHTVTYARDPSGKIVAERWIVRGGGHAWFGGGTGGTFTDPAGPDATAEMLRFFGSTKS